MLIQILLFIAASIPILWVSRRSLRQADSHGFYRFFAWEAILALFLLNARVWFHNPFSWYQIIAWSLLLISLFLALHGFWLLRQRGKPQETVRQEENLLPLEKTTQLVQTGAYRYIRHPLYSSLLFLTWGIFFKAPGWFGLLLAGAATFCLLRTAQCEEAENLRYFGPQYQEYMRHTRRFIPFIF